MKTFFSNILFNQLKKQMVYISFAFLFCSSSCVNKRIDRKLAEHYQYQTDGMLKASESVFNDEFAKLSWDEAEKLLFEKNIQYRTSQVNIKKVKDRKKDVWLDLLPDLYTYINLTSSFANFVSISKNDINTGISSRLRIPSPFAVYRQSYTAGLDLVGQTYSHELLRRNLTRDLYLLFKESERLREEMKGAQVLEDVESIPLSKLSGALIRQSEEKKRIRIARERFRTNINQLLNTPGANWNLVGSPPTVSYQSRVDQVKLKNGFGALGLKIQSVQIEYAVLGIRGARLERLPDVRWNISTPTLYDSERNENFDFDDDNFRLFTGLDKRLEFKDLFDKKNVQDAEFRFKINRERLALSFEQESSRLVMGQLAYRELLAKKKKIEHLIGEFKKGKGSRSPQAIIEDFSNLDIMRARYKDLDRQLLNMDLQFWIWDEDYWSEN